MHEYASQPFIRRPPQTPTLHGCAVRSAVLLIWGARVRALPYSILVAPIFPPNEWKHYQPLYLSIDLYFCPNRPIGCNLFAPFSHHFILCSVLIIFPQFLLIASFYLFIFQPASTHLHYATLQPTTVAHRRGLIAARPFHWHRNTALFHHCRVPSLDGGVFICLPPQALIDSLPQLQS